MASSVARARERRLEDRPESCSPADDAETATGRVAFDGALTVHAIKQSRTVAESFDAGAYGAADRKRPFGKAVAKGLKRLGQQLETLGSSLVKTSTAS